MARPLPKLTFVERPQVLEIIAGHILGLPSPNRPLDILEAGCGREWPFHLSDLSFRLTGVDSDPGALEFRKNERRDLDTALLGDLRTVELPPKSFDVIYNSFVLEHVDGAQQVLENFSRWLRPGGLLILTLPNRDSAYGFLTRMTPLWTHVIYKRYIKGNKNAGKPGHAPYPTYYDKAISRKALHEFAADKRLLLRGEHSFGREPRFVQAGMKIVEWLSLGRLSATDLSLLYVFEKW